MKNKGLTAIQELVIVLIIGLVVTAGYFIVQKDIFFNHEKSGGGGENKLPSFLVENFSIRPKKVEPGNPVEISALVKNTGKSIGEYLIQLKIEGKIESGNNIKLKPGEREKVSFTVKRSEEKVYGVMIENHRRIFSVEGGGPDLFAFYYPWYGTEDFSGSWYHWIDESHNPDSFIDNRRDIPAAHYPMLGVYDSKNPKVIREHINIAENAGINAFICSWWGKNTFSDKALSVIKEVCEREGFKFTIYYEKTQSVKGTLSDFNYLLKNYADSEC